VNAQDIGLGRVQLVAQRGVLRDVVDVAPRRSASRERAKSTINERMTFDE
jgi:hypothetical protein